MLPPFPKSWWVEPPKLLAGCYPGDVDSIACRQKLNALLDAGIRCILNLQQPDEVGGDEQPFVPYEPMLAELTRNRGVDLLCLRSPIRDMNVPTIREMSSALDKIDAEIANGRPVYVHCWGGHGRTGTVIGCWLVRHGFSGDRALERITELRSHDAYLRSQPAPQTDEQERFVLEWAKRDRIGGG